MKINWTKLVFNFLIIVLGILAFHLLIDVIPSWHRASLGDNDGITLLFVEILIVIFIIVGFKAWNKGKHNQVIIGGLILSSLFLAFLGWFTLPGQRILRSHDRVLDIEYMSKHFSGESDDQARYYAIERKARQLEERANSLRMQGIPVYRSKFDNWVMWGIAVILFLIAINRIYLYTMERANDKEEENPY